MSRQLRLPIRDPSTRHARVELPLPHADELHSPLLPGLLEAGRHQPGEPE
jgi:hypothetical protein